MNWHRSKTAENIFLNDSRFQVKSAGIAKAADTPLTKELIDWADWIFVMDEKQKTYIKTNFQINNNNKLLSLNIEDKYRYMDPELIKRLQEKISTFFK
jgi:predicted protein tyrosine phosphatase